MPQNPFSLASVWAQLGIKRDLSVGPEGIKSITLTHRDGSREIFRLAADEAINEEWDSYGMIRRISVTDADGEVHTFFDDHQNLSHKHYYFSDEENKVFERLKFQNGKWKSVVKNSTPELKACGAHGMGDSTLVGLLSGSLERLISYTQAHGDRFQLNVVDCGWYGNATGPTEGVQTLLDDFSVAMQRGARCMMWLENQAAKRAPKSAQARFLSRMIGQFAWVFERRQTIKCGVDDYSAARPPWNQRVRSERYPIPDPPDQTYQVLSQLRAGNRRLSGAAVTCFAESSHQGLLADQGEIPGIMLNMYGNSGGPEDNPMPRNLRQSKIFHEFFHLAGFTHGRNSNDDDFVQYLEDCCQTNMPYSQNSRCRAIVEGAAIGGNCSWHPEGKCFAN